MLTLAIPHTDCCVSVGIASYCGDLKYTDPTGQVWLPRAYLNTPLPGVGALYGGQVANAGDLLCIYRTECFGTFTMQVPGMSIS